MYITMRTIIAITAMALFMPKPHVFAAPEEISFRTIDGIDISATLSEPRGNHGPLPAVIFIHQGGSNKSEWTRQRVFSDVVNAGMVALAYDVRGHGQSGGRADFTTLFDDPLQAPFDLVAAIRYLIGTGKADEHRIAIVGASIGSNLAVMAAGRPDLPVKTAVAISGKTSAVYNLAGVPKEALSFRSVFHIASAGEQKGLRAKWAKELFDLTGNPRKIEIIENSDGHGVSIFEDDPALADRVMAWLRATL